MENTKVRLLINLIKDMSIKNKLRFGICLATCDSIPILYNKSEMYKKCDTLLKKIDEEYKTTVINFSKYGLVMFAMAKLIEMNDKERNKIVLFLFNIINA